MKKKLGMFLALTLSAAALAGMSYAQLCEQIVLLSLKSRKSTGSC